MTRVVSRALQPLCTSTALGKDWIPRLSVSSFERLRDDMVGFIEAPKSCKRASLGAQSAKPQQWLSIQLSTIARCIKIAATEQRTSPTRP